MSLYCPSEWFGGDNSYITTSSFYSNGIAPWGNGNDDSQNSASWEFRSNYITIDQANVEETREVQDWIPDE